MLTDFSASTAPIDLLALPANHLLDASQAAAVLGVKISTLSVWRSTKRYPLAWVKSGGLVRYKAADLLAFIESRTHEGGKV